MRIFGRVFGKASSPSPEKPDRIINFHSSDAEMNAAMELGRSTLPVFLARFDEPAVDETEFMVKFDIDPTEDVEFVWARVAGRSGTNLRVVLLSQSSNTEHKPGAQFTIRESYVVDWSHRKDGVTMGDFTGRVMLGRMSEADAAEHRAFMGW